MRVRVRVRARARARAMVRVGFEIMVWVRVRVTLNSFVLSEKALDRKSVIAMSVMLGFLIGLG